MHDMLSYWINHIIEALSLVQKGNNTAVEQWIPFEILGED